MPLFKFQLDKLEGRKKDPEPTIPFAEDEKFTPKDILAMVIAVLSLVLPWALAIVTVMGAAVWLFLQWAR